MNTALFNWFNGLAGRWPVADVVITFCADWLGYCLAIAMLIAAVIDRRTVRPMAVAVISALVARLIFVSAIRAVWHVPRPYVVLPDVVLLVQPNGWAFPSGHATFFFALAASLWLWDKRWGAAGLAVAVLCGISRIIAGVHWPADILGGAIVGTAAAVLVNFLIQKRRLMSA